ncbi:mitochondrial import receptor subunit TOM20 [Trichuris trichiura]|uniref:Mitochondrial import receptor subunit TOM20 n=1 Tax=Trichuris trichiura TaxID=36087 RepID=A0A077Z9J6_TRITR|nr:mitochondrial import receptor subunit TOM20 [Trichuris trichiura]
MSSTSKLVVAAGVGMAGLLFICYCIYFDRKRRSHPDFKEKLRKKRALERKKWEDAKKITFPFPPTMESVNRFFMKQIASSDELYNYGDVDGAARCLASALVASGQSPECLNFLRGNMPPDLFVALKKVFPDMKIEFQQAMAEMSKKVEKGEFVLTDEQYD